MVLQSEHHIWNNMLNHFSRAHYTQEGDIRQRRWVESETAWTHPLDVLAEGLAEAGAEDLELDVRVGAAVLKIHRTCQTRDVALKDGREVMTWDRFR